MKHMVIRSALACAFLFALQSVVAAQAAGDQGPSASSGASSSVSADNTRRNRDPSNRSTGTADEQKENAADRTLTQQIRKSVMADKSLSTYAHNVKIVTVNGAVTLNGVVRSEEEKASVAAKAEEVAGKGRVTNDLSVAPKGASKGSKGSKGSR